MHVRLPPSPPRKRTCTCHHFLLNFRQDLIQIFSKIKPSLARSMNLMGSVRKRKHRLRTPVSAGAWHTALD